MGAIASLDDLVNKATGGNNGNPEHVWWHKHARINGSAVSMVANREYSMWMWDGMPSGAGSAPGAAAAPTNATDGALKQADPGGGRQKWLTYFSNALGLTIATIMLYDRLLHVSGLSGTVTTPQAVGGSITRYTGADAAGNLMWTEIYSAVGNTARVLTANYTDENGAAQVSNGVSIGSSANQDVSRIALIPLAAGGQGVQSVTDVTVAGSTLTAGDFGITIGRPIAFLTLDQIGGGGSPVTYLEQVAEIKPGACLAMTLFTHSIPSSFACMGQLSMVEA